MLLGRTLDGGRIVSLLHAARIHEPAAIAPATQAAGASDNGTLLQRDGHDQLLRHAVTVIALDQQRPLLTTTLHRPLEGSYIADRNAIDTQDDIAGLQPRLGRGSGDIGHHDIAAGLELALLRRRKRTDRQ